MVEVAGVEPASCLLFRITSTTIAYFLLPSDISILGSDLLFVLTQFLLQCRLSVLRRLMTPYPLYLRQEARGGSCLSCQSEFFAASGEVLKTNNVISIYRCMPFCEAWHLFVLL